PHLPRRAREHEPRALPEVVVVDLGDRGTEALLQLRLRRLDVLALALQRPRVGEVQLDREDPHVAGGVAHYRRLLPSGGERATRDLREPPTLGGRLAQPLGGLGARLALIEAPLPVPAAE